MPTIVQSSHCLHYMRKKKKKELDQMPRSELCPAIPKQFESITIFGEQHDWFLSHNLTADSIHTESIVFCLTDVLPYIQESVVLIGDGTFMAASKDTGA